MTNEQLPSEPEHCGAGNPLVQAYCRLRKGHDGQHCGHGPTWTWGDIDETAQTVAPSTPPPVD